MRLCMCCAKREMRLAVRSVGSCQMHAATGGSEPIDVQRSLLPRSAGLHHPTSPLFDAIMVLGENPHSKVHRVHRVHHRLSQSRHGGHSVVVYR